MSSKDDSNEPEFVASTGRRLLANPNKELILRVYSGSMNAFKKCVISNFPGADKPKAKVE
jgi:hypothetical protein